MRGGWLELGGEGVEGTSFTFTSCSFFMHPCYKKVVYIKIKQSLVK